MIFKKVTDGIFRGSQPETKRDFEFLLNHGVETIINLNNEIYPMEQWFVSKNQLCYYELSLSEFRAPSPAILKHIAYLIKSSEKSVYIHCKHGKDRTGYAVAAYRMIVQGWTFDEAWNELIANGHRWLFYFWWKGALREVSKYQRIRVSK